MEKTFKEVPRATKVAGRFPDQKAGLTPTWATLEVNRLKWRRIRVDREDLEGIEVASEEVARRPLKIMCAQAFLEAA